MSTISDKIADAMRVYGMILPAPVRAVLQEIGTELVNLRAELEQLKGDHGKAD